VARTPLANWLQAAYDATIADDERRLTRRELLRRAGAAGAVAAGAGTFGALAAEARGAVAPRIAIVGAGLAGLAAAHTLRRAGYAAEVYEASDRVGGRCWTIRGEFADGQIAEHGGELIDQGHTQIRQLAQSFGLKLDNLLAGELNGTDCSATSTAPRTPRRMRPTT
jgi:monoamine oxidase